MMPARRILWIPSFLLGAAAAAALGTGAGLLLYNDGGLFQAGVVVAGVGFGSIGAGLFGAGFGESEGDAPAGGWWLGFLLALLGGAGFAVAWEAMDGFSAARPAQGLGLALTSALPAYFAAGAWARVRVLEKQLADGPRRQATLGAVLGAGLGALLVATFLGRPVWAVTAFLLAMVLASSGARLHVWILDRVPRLSRSVGSPERPALRFEEWRTDVPEATTRVIREGAATRLLDPPRQGDWRIGAASALNRGGPILFVGAGSWFDPGAGRTWQLCEADDAVRELALKGFGWGDSVVAASPVPDAEGWVLVVDAQAAPLVRLSALREAGVRRVWIGGSRGGVPEALLAEARDAGLALGGYRSAVAGAPGPPRSAPRADELWCVGFREEAPTSVAGMEALPP